MVKTIKIASGETVALRFDLGTSRIFKGITKIDPISNEADVISFEEQAAKIFLAAYKRAFAVSKTVQPLTDEEAQELFYELELSDAVDIVKSFTAAMSVKPDPSAPVAAAVEGEEPKKS